MQYSEELSKPRIISKLYQNLSIKNYIETNLIVIQEKRINIMSIV